MARRLAAIVFSDIAGFTALTQRDERAALQLLQEQESLVLPLLGTHRGRQVKSTGDGLLLEFSNVLDTIEYAVDLQRRVHERNARPGGEPLRLKMAIHLGDVQDVGTDLFGEAINIAAHILPLADPGGVLLSEQVYVQVRNKVPYQLEKLGSRFIKGVQGPTEVYRVVLPWEHDGVPPGPLLSRRLAAIMITDVVGFTASAQANEADALARLREQERIVRSLFEPFKGREIKSTGDGFLVEFESALGAVECAVEIQRRMRERNSKKPGYPLELRIGIHVGDVEESGGDIFGDAVNIASRVEPLAEPGGVCLSEPVYVQVRSKVPFPLEKLGVKTLKGVREPMEIYRAVLPWAPERTVPDGPPLPRIAVLPLANISPDPKDEYFADGLTEELISVLSRIPGLGVIARTSVNQYRSTGKPVTQIGSELGVTSVLEGSVRKSGNRLRITLQLIDVPTQEHRWSDSYDRELGDVFAIQAAVAQEVSETLKLRLRPSEGGSRPRVPTSSSQAYAFCLKGTVTLARSETEDGLKQALGLFEAAVAEDPQYPAAHVGVARCLHAFEDRGYDAGPQAIRRAKESARAALRLDPHCAEAHAELGSITTHEGDWAGAVEEMERALEINPNLADSHYVLSQILHNTGRPHEAMEHALQAVELDPLSVDSHTRVAWECLIQGRYDEAISHLQSAIEIVPDRAGSHGNLAVAYVKRGLVDKALEEIRTGSLLQGGHQPRFLGDAAWVYSQAGRREEAQQILGELTQGDKGGGGYATVVAGAYAILGDRERALEWLQVARQESAGITPSLLDWVWFDSVRDDPQFQDLVRGIGLKLRAKDGA